MLKICNYTVLICTIYCIYCITIIIPMMRATFIRPSRVQPGGQVVQADGSLRYIHVTTEED